MQSHGNSDDRPPKIKQKYLLSHNIILLRFSQTCELRSSKAN